MAGELPPVAARVRLRAGAPPPQFAGYHALWVDSGTSALALALLCARQGRPEIETPAVIVPAYGCPDLVSAAEYAGVRPLLCDIGPDDPGYCLDALRATLSPNVIAVVAVNFLGIAERLASIRELIARAGISAALIEDNAQWFPERPDALQGEFVILSLGRGKPVSLLGGGCLLVSESNAAALNEAESVLANAGGPLGTSARWRAKCWLLNLLQQRHLYRLATRNPWVTVGDTWYEPLQRIAPLGDRLAFVGAAADRYLAQDRWRETQLDRVVGEVPGVVALPSAAHERACRLLRYPLLCRDRAQRDRLLQRATEQGLGFTAMYRQPLLRIAGVAERVRVSGDSLSGAGQFAERLLTLPLHEGVSERDMQRMAALLAAEA